MSDVAALLMPPAKRRHTSPTAKPWLRRSLKFGAAAALLLVAAFAVVSGEGFVASNNAVVSAYTVSIRAPIAGEVSQLSVRVGDAVAPTASLARIEDARVDEQRLVDLRQLVTRNAAEQAAYASERENLINLRNSLLRRASDHDAMEVEYLGRQADEAALNLDARAARRDQARQDLVRKATLGHDGWAATADVDRSRTETTVADRETQSQNARAAMLRIQHAAARRGVFLEGGSNDVSYSAQRADEVSIRIAETDRAIASLMAAAAEASGRLQAEERRLAMQREAALVSPSRGSVWKLGASNGERLGVGDVAVELIDCKSAFILAAIPQERFGDIEIGGVARFRLSGETTDRSGHVVSVTGDGNFRRDRNIAAAPLDERGATAIARVQIETPDGTCFVGRTARVLLPATSGRNLLTRIVQQFI